jgi:hypothetical protein
LSEQLAQLFSDPAIRELGSALRTALRHKHSQDYASLIELENAESVPQFADALTNFLRRFDSFQRRRKKDWRPATANYERVMSLAAEPSKEAVRLVKAALISHALTYTPSTKDKEEETDV